MSKGVFDQFKMAQEIDRVARGGLDGLKSRAAKALASRQKTIMVNPYSILAIIALSDQVGAENVALKAELERLREEKPAEIALEF